MSLKKILFENINIKNVGVLLYNKSKEEFLILKRSRRTKAPNQWSIPSGKVETNEDPKEAVIRELEEETGFNKSLNIKLLDHIDDGRYNFGIYLGIISAEFEPDLNWENSEYKWLSHDKLIEMSESLTAKSTIHTGFLKFLRNNKEKLNKF